MFNETYEDGEREGFYAGYKDGKKGKDYFKHTQCKPSKDDKYEEGWKVGYANGFKVGQKKKYTS